MTENDRNISIAKLKRFGKEVRMLSFHYLLKEDIPPSEVCNKINSQTDEETIWELKRVGLLEGLVGKLQNLDAKSPNIVIERNGIKTEYIKTRDSTALVNTKEGTNVDILVGIGKIEDNSLMGFMVSAGGSDMDMSVPVIIDYDETTEMVNTSEDKSEEDIIPNTSAGICGWKIKNNIVEKIDGGTVIAPAIFADYIEYKNDFAIYIKNRGREINIGR